MDEWMYGCYWVAREWDGTGWDGMKWVRLGWTKYQYHTERYRLAFIRMLWAAISHLFLTLIIYHVQSICVCSGPINRCFIYFFFPPSMQATAYHYPLLFFVLSTSETYITASSLCG